MNGRYKGFPYSPLGFPDGSDGKESTCNAEDLGSSPGLGRFPREGHGNPLQYSWPGEFQGQRSLAGYSPWGRKELDMIERLSHSFFYIVPAPHMHSLPRYHHPPSEWSVCYHGRTYVIDTQRIHVYLLSRDQLFVTPQTAALQAPLFIGFSRQEYWSGLPFPPPGDLPDPGIEPKYLGSPALVVGFFTNHATWEAQSP